VAYTTTNFRTKRELREAVESGKRVTIRAEFVGPTPTEGRVFIEGPHGVHNWYAECTMQNGSIVHVR
jgi:hypothetical protein